MKIETETEKDNLACVILAAGKGTRMKSSLPKVMHKVACKPMLSHVVDTALLCRPRKIVVVTSSDMESVRSDIKERYFGIVESVVQPQQLGTGDAVKAAKEALAGFVGNVIVLYGDTPLIRPETIAIMSTLLNSKPYINMAILGMEVAPPNEYGKLILDSKGDVKRIVESKDSTLDEKSLTLCNSGVMIIRSHILFELLDKIQNKNAQGEYYLTDLIALARDDGHPCSLVTANPYEVMGVNSRIELSVAEGNIQKRLRRQLMENGVTLLKPSSVYLASDTKIANDVTIHTNVVFGAGVEVEEGVEIREFSSIEGATIKKNAVVGPFARIRAGSEVGESAHIGNFVELKKTIVEAGAKVNHLSYIGDSHIGAKANIGAGTITCNYDGINKYQTEIGAGAFIGSNSCLVAPVNIGSGAIVAAGSVITADVAADALAIARGKQEEKQGWAKEFREKNAKK